MTRTEANLIALALLQAREDADGPGARWGVDSASNAVADALGQINPGLSRRTFLQTAGASFDFRDGEVRP